MIYPLSTTDVFCCFSKDAQLVWTAPFSLLVRMRFGKNCDHLLEYSLSYSSKTAKFLIIMTEYVDKLMAEFPWEAEHKYINFIRVLKEV